MSPSCYPPLYHHHSTSSEHARTLARNVSRQERSLWEAHQQNVTEKNLHSCDRTLTHHHQRPRATCGDSGARRDDRATMRAVVRTPGAVPLGATSGTSSTVFARRVLARAARSLDPIRHGRMVRRGRLIRRVGPNVLAPEARARADDTRAEREPDRDPRRYASGAAAAAVALALLAETCAAPASASPLGHHVPAASHPRRRPATHLPATPRANPRPYPVLPHIASARTTEPVSAVAAAAPAPAPAILAPSPPAPPDPAAVELGKVRADLKKETRAANRELARAEAARAAAAAEAAKAAEAAASPSARNKPRVAPSWTPGDARDVPSSTTPPHPPPPESSSSRRSGRCGDPRAGPFSSPPPFETSSRDARRRKRCTRCDGTTPRRNPRARTASRRPSLSRSFEGRCATSNRPSPTQTGCRADTRTCRTWLSWNRTFGF